MKLSKDMIHQVWINDKKKDLKNTIILIAVTIFIFLACMITIYFGYIIKPSRYFYPYIDKSLMMAFGAGVGLAVSGAIFQTLYHNPMASPNIIGATAGVKLGNVLMVYLYSYQAYQFITTRYKLCYGLAIVCVLFVLLLGKLSKNKENHFSVVEIMMAGSVISQFLNVLTMYLMYSLTDEDMLIYQQITMGVNITTDMTSLFLFFFLLLGGLIPIFIIKYRFNIVGIDPQEAQSIGVRTWPISVIAQCCSVFIATAATVHCGDIGMISMMIPYLVRSFIGADFRKVVIYSACTGGCLVMLARLVGLFVTILGEPLPMSFILNFVLMPVFLILLAKRKEEY